MGKYIDVIGQRFGRLVVISRSQPPSHVINQHLVYLKCLCDCGKETIVVSADLRGGHTKSCGCKNLELAIDMSGQKIGKLSVIKQVKAPDEIKNKTAAYFLCQCDCGNMKIASGNSLRRERTTHCGCDKFIDISGQVFGRLTVMSKVNRHGHGTEKTRAYFLCKCTCGVEKIIAGKALRGGQTSCGCDNKYSDIEELKLASAKSVFRSVYNDGDLTFEEFLELSQMVCHYCNAVPSNCHNSFNRKSCTEFSRLNGGFIYSGLDRINSNHAHNKTNVVPCCKVCNKMKSDLSKDEFKAHITKIYNHHIKGEED